MCAFHGLKFIIVGWIEIIFQVADLVWGMPRAMLGSSGAPGLSVWVRSDAFCDRSGLPPKRRKLRSVRFGSNQKFDG